MSLANNQDRLRRWGFLSDTSAGYGPNTEAAYTKALDLLETLHPLPAAPTSFKHKNLKDSTILAAQASERAHGVPAGISLAQYALESGWGEKDLGVHNYGGIKVRRADIGADGKPTVPAINLPTREVVNGKSVMMNQWFRAFKDEADYFDFHGRLLANGVYMKDAIMQLPSLGKFADKLGGGTPQNPRYATDPGYGASIRALLAGNDLMRLNLGKFVI